MSDLAGGEPPRHPRRMSAPGVLRDASARQDDFSRVCGKALTYLLLLFVFLCHPSDGAPRQQIALGAPHARTVASVDVIEIAWCVLFTYVPPHLCLSRASAHTHSPTSSPITTCFLICQVSLFEFQEPLNASNLTSIAYALSVLGFPITVDEVFYLSGTPVQHVTDVGM